MVEGCLESQLAPPASPALRMLHVGVMPLLECCCYLLGVIMCQVACGMSLLEVSLCHSCTMPCFLCHRDLPNASCACLRVCKGVHGHSVHSVHGHSTPPGHVWNCAAKKEHKLLGQARYMSGRHPGLGVMSDGLAASYGLHPAAFGLTTCTPDAQAHGGFPVCLQAGVVQLVRSAGPGLARGKQINLYAVCPEFIDTPLVSVEEGCSNNAHQGT